MFLRSGLLTRLTLKGMGSFPWSRPQIQAENIWAPLQHLYYYHTDGHILSVQGGLGFWFTAFRAGEDQWCFFCSSQRLDFKDSSEEWGGEGGDVWEQAGGLPNITIQINSFNNWNSSNLELCLIGIWSIWRIWSIYSISYIYWKTQDNHKKNPTKKITKVINENSILESSPLGQSEKYRTKNSYKNYISMCIIMYICGKNAMQNIMILTIILNMIKYKIKPSISIQIVRLKYKTRA